MSSRRRQRRKRCVGKRAYPSLAAAVNACAIAKRHWPQLGEVNAYHCTACGDFHWGHLPKKVRRAIEERREG